MDENIRFFVGLDVHKHTIAVAVAEADRQPARLIGCIAHFVKLRQVTARHGTECIFSELTTRDTSQRP